LTTSPDNRSPAYQPAERYKEKSLQKLEGKDTRSRPSADIPLAQPASGSIGRRATVDVNPSSGSRGARRKPVQTPTPQEFFEWKDEPQVITTPIVADMPTTGGHKSRNRHMGVYRDAPTPTWSKGTAPRLEERQNLSASVGHQASSQPTHFVVSGASLGRYHSASASVPSTFLPGSARTTVATTPTNSNQKIPYTSTSTTPTPKAQTFNNIGTSKSYKHMSASNQELPSEERRRKISHNRNPSASTQAASPSSCSTTGSSGFDTWRSANSHSESQHQRRRGLSDAPAPQTHYIGKAMDLSSTSISNTGGEERGRKREKEDTSFMGRIRTRSNSLTKSIAKVINYPKYLGSKVEEKKKEKEAKRLSKQQGVQQPPPPQHLGQGGSAILTTSASDAGHSLAYSYSSASTATTSSTTNSPVSHRSQSVQPRPKKLLSSREKQQRDDYRASPMTKAKFQVLEKFEGMDLNPRQSGFEPLQVQVEQQHHRWMPTSAIPFMDDSARQRRR